MSRRRNRKPEMSRVPTKWLKKNITQKINKQYESSSFIFLNSNGNFPFQLTVTLLLTLQTQRLSKFSPFFQTLYTHQIFITMITVRILLFLAWHSFHLTETWNQNNSRRWNVWFFLCCRLHCSSEPNRLIDNLFSKISNII